MKLCGNNNRFAGYMVHFVLLWVCVVLGMSFAHAQWAEYGNNIYNTNSGNVGIGTSTPSQALHIYGDDYHSILKLQGTGTAYGPKIQIWSFAANGRNFSLHSGQSFDFGGAIAGKFAIADDSAGAVRVVVDGNGSFGIGTTSPQARLHVAGDIIADGNIAAKYQDIAEWVLARQTISSGSVVVLVPGQVNSVVRSSTAYDTRVAGVVSSNPGIVLGEVGEGKVLISTTGRVKVWVDATAAPIEVGDLLVTSSKEGMAMRSQPVSLGGIEMHRPGTLIGKALEPLKAGEGEILVLLSLQ